MIAIDLPAEFVLMSHDSPWVRGCGDSESAIRWSPDSQWLLYTYFLPDMHAGRVVAGMEDFYRLCNTEGCREIHEVAWVGMTANNRIYLIRGLPVRE